LLQGKNCRGFVQVFTFPWFAFVCSQVRRQHDGGGVLAAHAWVRHAAAAAKDLEKKHAAAAAKDLEKKTLTVKNCTIFNKTALGFFITKAT